MGYDAFVICNCYKNGETTEPPHKEFMVIDDEGIYLNLESIFQDNRDEYYKKHQEFDAWKNNACPHEDMEIVSERLANISGMSAFRTIINESGGKTKYPTLTEFLPVANGGTLPNKYAQQALQEINSLENENSNEEKVVLKLKSTGERKHSTNVNSEHVFIWTAFNKLNYGLNRNGFYILENRKKILKTESEIVFSSKDFTQETLGDGKFKFIDNPSGNEYIGKAKIHPDENESPKEKFDFLVEMINFTISEEYDYIIIPLKKLIKASIETGNPIIWT